MKEIMDKFLSHLQKISAPQLREFVNKMLQQAPEVFYTRSTSKGVHSEDEHGEYGLLLHVSRVVDLVEIIADAANLDQANQDMLIAAAMLHDIGYYGVKGEYDSAQNNHHMLVRKIAEDCGLYDSVYEELFIIIEKHMGWRFDPPFTPELSLPSALHLADCIVSVWDGKNKILPRISS